MKRSNDPKAKALELWNQAAPANKEHAYLVAKGITETNARQLENGRLVIPITSFSGEIDSLQFISQEGQKRYLSGAQKKGNFVPLRELSQSPSRVLICEGWATAESLQVAFPDEQILAAIDAGNLSPVVRGAKKFWPEAEVVVCADNDWAKSNNVGLDAARKAASDHGCSIAFPEFFGNGGSDYNDLMLSEGVDAVRASVSAAEKPRSRLQLLSASDIKPIAYSWLWDGWLAEGKIHLIAGQAGTSKTSLSIEMASIVSRGGQWPDGTSSPRGNVLIWSSEDDPADTLVPRLIAAGADLSNVHFPDHLADPDTDGEFYFDPAEHLDELYKKIQEIGNVRLLILDPVVSVVTSDSHKNAEVRRDLQPLVDLARESKCAVVGVTHLTKGTQSYSNIERVTGSLAFGAVARLVMFVAKRDDAKPDDSGPSRVLCRVKSNIGPDTGGFSYDVLQTPLEELDGLHVSKVVWDEYLEGGPNEILAMVGDDEDAKSPSQRSSAKDFLFGLLRDGGLPALFIKEEAIRWGFSTPTLNRAATDLGIIHEKIGGHFGSDKQFWMWVLPDQESTDALLANGNASPPEGTQAVQEKWYREHKIQRAFSQAWFHSNAELDPDGSPMISDERFKDFCSEARYSDNYAEAVIRSLINLNEIARVENGWIVIGPGYRADLLKRKSETNEDSHRHTEDLEHLEDVQPEETGG